MTACEYQVIIAKFDQKAESTGSEVVKLLVI
jgi:hypothetical protein